jgi:hypothetical protein
MTEARRIKPDEARRKVQAGDALFVCAYESEETCSGPLQLEGSMTLGELNSRLDSIPKEQEIIFYCK